MFGRLKSLIQRGGNGIGETSRSSRELETDTGKDSIDRTSESSREPGTPSSWGASFEGFRYMLKDLSRRLEAIRNNPEETYLINTEISVRVLEALENLGQLTEKNAAVLEALFSKVETGPSKQEEADKHRRAREVLAVLERCGPLGYEELRKELEPEVSYNRITALVSEMIRDGVPLRREGKPVKVSVVGTLTGSN